MTEKIPNRDREVFSEDILDTYFHDIEKHPLLTHEEAADLGKRIQAGIGAEEAVAAGVFIPDNIYADVIEEAAHAREKLTVSNLRLVVSIARNKFYDRYDSLTDAIQEGSKGLMQAVERFNPEKGYTFSTYATRWIYQALQRGEGSGGKTPTRIPSSALEQLHRFNRTEEWLVAEYGSISDEEIAEIAGVKLEIILMIKRSKKSLRLDEPAYRDDQTSVTRHDRLSLFEQSDFTDEIHVNDIENHLLQALNALTQDERYVIDSYYGLAGEVVPVYEMQKNLGYSKMKIYSIRKRAEEKIYNKMVSAAVIESDEDIQLLAG